MKEQSNNNNLSSSHHCRHSHHNVIFLLWAIGKLSSTSQVSSPCWRNTVAFLLSRSAWRSLPLTLALEPFIHFPRLSFSASPRRDPWSIWRHFLWRRSERTDLNASVLTSHSALTRAYFLRTCVPFDSGWHVRHAAERLCEFALFSRNQTPRLQRCLLQPVMRKEFTHLDSKKRYFGFCLEGLKLYLPLIAIFKCDSVARAVNMACILSSFRLKACSLDSLSLEGLWKGAWLNFQS